MNWSSCVLGRSQSVIWSTGMYDVCMMHSSCDKTCQPGRIDFFKWHNKGKHQCEVACSVLEKVKEKKKSKFDLVFFFFFSKMRQEVNSQNFFWSAICIYFNMVYHKTSQNVPQNNHKYHSVLVTLNSRDSLCVADLSLAASQELCFERDAGRGLPSAVGSWVSTASFNIQTLLISFDGSLKTRLQVRRCCDEWPVGGRKIYNRLLHIHWSLKAAWQNMALLCMTWFNYWWRLPISPSQVGWNYSGNDFELYENHPKVPGDQ